MKSDYSTAVDGKVYVFRKGRVVIDAATIFCVRDRRNDGVANHANLGRIYLYESMRAAGQVEQWNGVGRVKFNECSPSPNAVLITRTLSRTNDGRPYKLQWIALRGPSELAIVLQRDARDPRNWPIKLTQFARIDNAITYDGDRMSKLLAGEIFKGKSR